jgi:hypothetical protein
MSEAGGGSLGRGALDLASTQQPPVALDAGFELRKFAVGGALCAPRHLPARGEPHEGFGDPEGCLVMVAPLVEGGEPLVGVASDELFGDARLVQADGLLRVAALLGPRGLCVALHRGLEAAQRVVLRPDPLPLSYIEAEEPRGFLRRPGLLPAEDSP